MHDGLQEYDVPRQAKRKGPDSETQSVQIFARTHSAKSLGASLMLLWCTVLLAEHASPATAFAPSSFLNIHPRPHWIAHKCKFLSRSLRAGRCTLRMSFDAAAGADTIQNDITQGLNKFVFVRGLDQEQATEMRAIVLVAVRGYKRRIGSGAPVTSLDQVKADLHSMIRTQLVDIEQIINGDDWDKIIGGFQQANDVAENYKVASDIESIKDQLRRLFPNASEQEVEDAARRGTTLENAVTLVMDSTWAPAADAQMPVVAPRRRILSPPAPGEDGRHLTPGVNSGASAFGLFFDVEAFELPIEIKALRTASSPMLGFGRGKPLSVSVYSTPESALGREHDAGFWGLHADAEGASLPLVSWMDPEPQYGDITLDPPITLQPGERKGVCVRTNDISGMVVRMNDGKPSDTDFMDQDFGGSEGDDDVAGITQRFFRTGECSSEDGALALYCGYTTPAPRFGQEPACVPVVAAFVGELLYTVLPS